MNVCFVSRGKVFDTGECSSNLNLLAHAQIIELDIGSRCGGHGKCGRDLVQVAHEDAHKLSPLTAIERHQLSPEQIQQGFRLACQAFPDQKGVRLLFDDQSVK